MKQFTALFRINLTGLKFEKLSILLFLGEANYNLT